MPCMLWQQKNQLLFVSTRPLFLAIFILRDIHGRYARLERGLNLGELVR